VTAVEKRRVWQGLAFASPWIAGFLIFTAYPMVASAYFSFTYFNLVKPPVFVGLENYVHLFTGDKQLGQAMFNTMYITILANPASLAFGLLCALLLNAKVGGQAVYRTLYVLPIIMPGVATGVLWRWLMNPTLGLFNTILGYVGIRGPAWWANPGWSKPSLIIMELWLNGMVTIIYLAGLQGIPKELYESAELDGAGTARRFQHITLPMVSGVTLFNLVTGLIWSFQLFTEPFILAGVGGAPQGSMLFYSVLLYGNAFKYLKMGYASAMAWVLFFVVLAVTLVTLRLSASRTYYDVSAGG
jgi:multiple sugar transport system permease protein